jgi:lysophospholipase L1-like esterase
MRKITSLKSTVLYSALISSCIFLSMFTLKAQSGSDSAKIWVGTWGTAPQLVETGNNPPAPGLNNNSLRQIVRVSIGGDTLRVRFSNRFSDTPVTMKSVQIAVSAGGNSIVDSTNVKLTFGGNYDVTMDSGVTINSDPIAFDLEQRMSLAITIYFETTCSKITGHPGSRTTSYILTGNDTAVTDFTGAVTTDHWYVINGIDVLVPPTYSCVAVIGNSITDGRGSTTNMQNRWTDRLSERLLLNSSTQNVGMINLGLGGNCVLRYCLGPAAIDRYKWDILEQPGVRAAIVFEGVNDIGAAGNYQDVATIANGLIAAYNEIIDSVHAQNIFVYGATILPFKGSSYYNMYTEDCRNKVNNWIRNSGRFDAVIDFDLKFRSQKDSAKLGMHTYENDCLHPDANGYRAMGDYVDLNIFAGIDSLFPTIDTTRIESLWIEPECGMVGDDWKLFIDNQASNFGYAMVKAGFNSTSEVPDDNTSTITIPFTVNYDSTYYVYARVNGSGSNHDSYWLKMDDGIFIQYDNLSTSGWEWKEVNNYLLTTGEHSITFAYSEDSVKLDKLFITNDTVVPTGIGKPAISVCMPDTLSHISAIPNHPINTYLYTLGQNYPNPFTGKTYIDFTIPSNSYVSLKVYSVLGDEIAELAGKEYTTGVHNVVFDSKNYTKGIYFYTLKTDRYTATRKMLIQGN